jgi:hypothetical protein
MNLRIARKVMGHYHPVDDWRRRNGLPSRSPYSAAQEARARVIVARWHRRLIHFWWPQAQHWMCLGKDIFHGPPYALWLADQDGAGLCHYGPWRQTKHEVARDGEFTGFTETQGVRRRLPQ